MLMCLKMDSTSYVQRPQHAGISYCDRTQDTELAQQCHCLTFHTAVCCNQKEKSKMWGVVPGAWDWSMGTWLV